MNDRAIVFVTDSGFLAQSMLAAKQLVAQGLDGLADVLIYTIDIEQPALDRLRGQVAPIRLLPLQSRSFLPGDSVELQLKHVPAASLARLVIEPELPQEYRHIVYLDGDVQIVGDVLPFVRYDVPRGKLLAARGSAWLDPTQEHAIDPPGYLESLGGLATHQYFNAGVLAFARETWAEDGPRALRFFMEDPARSIRIDQSALNAVFNGRVIELPPTYNFHWFYATAYSGRRFPPRILHFTGGRKPWLLPGPPWGLAAYDRYVELLREHPDLRGFLTLPDRGTAETQARAWASEVRRLWRDRDFTRQRRRLFADHMRTGRFPIPA